MTHGSGSLRWLVAGTCATVCAASLGLAGCDQAPPAALPAGPAAVPVIELLPPEVRRQLHAADAVLLHGDWDQALEKYRAIAAEHPGSDAIFYTKLGMARAYRGQGDSVQMVALVQELANQPAADTHACPMDEGSPRNQAYEALAEYHLEREEWKAALPWWEQWRPSSGCGTCQQELEEKRQAAIQQCRSKLGLPPLSGTPSGVD